MDEIIKDIYSLFIEDEQVIDKDTHLVYPESGRIWNKRCKRFVNCAHGDGYLRFRYKGKHIYNHRFIYEAVHGSIPDGMQINHLDNDRSNNRIDNLEVVSRQQNNQWRDKDINNTSGFKGVYWRNDMLKYQARIGFNGKDINLGHFDNPEEAYAAYCERAKYLNDNFGCKYKI